MLLSSSLIPHWILLMGKWCSELLVWFQTSKSITERDGMWIMILPFKARGKESDWAQFFPYQGFTHLQWLATSFWHKSTDLTEIFNWNWKTAFPFLFTKSIKTSLRNYQFMVTMIVHSTLSCLGLKIKIWARTKSCITQGHRKTFL